MAIMATATETAKRIPPDALRVRSQRGPQTAFLRSDADIVIYGGSAGGGKSWALLVAPLRWVGNPHFGAVIFRRTYPEIEAEGGLWDESETIYPLVGGVGSRHAMTWNFPGGGAISFSHMADEADRLRWMGAQVPFIGFDQLETFTETQFWYMMSRNRSSCGTPLQIRATCNPNPDSFVARLVEWYIDPATGYPIKERSGRRRYFARAGDAFDWADTPNELIRRHGKECMPKSFTFIAATIQDNPILLRKNPRYLSNLRAMSLVDNEQLEKGNWKIRASAGLVFKREWFPVVDAAPTDANVIRYWDLAATEDGDWSCGCRVARARETGVYYVADVVRFRANPYDTEQAIKTIASQDGRAVTIGLSQDPGQAGKWEVDHLVRALDGYSVITHREEGDKVQRANPFSAQAGAGNVKLVRGAWNEDFLRELENFPSVGWHDDQVDAASNGYYILAHRLVMLPDQGMSSLYEAWTARADRSIIA